MSGSFKAVRLDQLEGKTRASLADLSVDDLPPGEVLVDVVYSTLNYKDALAITGAGKIVRQFPFVPGIDLAGTVSESADARFAPGDAVILTGWGVGERHWGGLAQKARVKADWLLPLPDGLSLEQAMAVGTAAGGYDPVSGPGQQWDGHAAHAARGAGDHQLAALRRDALLL